MCVEEEVSPGISHKPRNDQHTVPPGLNKRGGESLFCYYTHHAPTGAKNKTSQDVVRIMSYVLCLT